MRAMVVIWSMYVHITKRGVLALLGFTKLAKPKFEEIYWDISSNNQMFYFLSVNIRYQKLWNENQKICSVCKIINPNILKWFFFSIRFLFFLFISIFCNILSISNGFDEKADSIIVLLLFFKFYFCEWNVLPSKDQKIEKKNLTQRYEAMEV